MKLTMGRFRVYCDKINEYSNAYDTKQENSDSGCASNEKSDDLNYFETDEQMKSRKITENIQNTLQFILKEKEEIRVKHNFLD